MTIQKNWQELIKPNKLEISADGDTARFATVVAEPLERGFGLTLGNALRRVRNLSPCRNHYQSWKPIKCGMMIQL